MSEDTICLMCGMEGSLTPAQFTKSVAIPPGPSIEYMEQLIHCAVCQEYYHSKENDLHIEKALKASEFKAIGIMLDKLPWGHSVIERVLHLPFGSLTNWRQGNYTPEAVALLRIIHYNPQIIDIMDNI